MLHRPRHTIAAHEVHVWHVLAEHVAEFNVLTAAEAMMSDDERRRASNFRQERDRLLFVLSRGLMRSVLASYLDCAARDVRFGGDDHGKPILRAEDHGQQLHFNLTHSRGAVALAIGAGREVGIDVEERHRTVDYLALAERFFAPAEAKHLQALPRHELPSAFFAIWTLKEAYVKGIGRGLTFPLDAFCFDLEGSRLLRFRPLADFVSCDWHFQQFDLGARHCGAIAVRNPAGDAVAVEMRDWREAFLA